MTKLIKIDKDLLINILSNGLGYSVENNPIVGKVIRLSARQAFSYAVITSHGYLDLGEPENLFRLTRDNFRVFNQAQRFDLQEGIFSLSDLRLVGTVNNEVERKPYITKNDKFVLVIEYTQYEEFKSYLEKIANELSNNGFKANDFIISPIRKAQSGTSELESFFEYVVSVYFNRMKYITDTQIPFFYGIGTPDVAAYRIPRLLDVLIKHGFIENGSSIVELMTTSSFGFYKTSQRSEIKNESIVFEVKTNQLTAPQIEKYTKTKIFNKAYEVIPSNKDPESYAGLLTIDPDGKLMLYECKKPIPFSDVAQKEYFEWIEIYLKMYLIANLKTDELEDLIEKNSFKMSIDELIKFVKKIDFEDLVMSVKKYLEKRQ